MSQIKKNRQQDLIPFAQGETVALIALERIDTAPQVRTEFDEESLADLARDIEAHGVMQPILVRQVEEGRFLIVAGERRFRAASLAGLTTIPALVRDIDEDTARDMQLAENIQREELTLQEEAKAIRTLYDREKKLDKVAAIVSKSKAWVSKRLALTLDNFSWQARQLLERGITEDMEVLNLVNKAEKEFGGYAASQMAALIAKGEMNRTKAREHVKALRTETESENITANDEADEHAKTPSAPREREEWEILNELEERMEDCRQNRTEPDIQHWIGPLSLEERNTVINEFAEKYEQGRAAGTQPTEPACIRALQNINAYNDWTKAAVYLGFMGGELSLNALINEVWERTR